MTPHRFLLVLVAPALIVAGLLIITSVVAIVLLGLFVYALYRLIDYWL